MANADIRNPIVINATTSTLIAGADFVRQVCFVSLGETKMTKGEYRKIDRTELKDVLAKTDTELEYRLNSFFAYATNKLAGILELGEQPIIPANESFTNLFNYLGTIGASDEGWNKFIYDKWDKADEETQISNYFGQLGVTADYDQWRTLNNKNTDDLATKKEYLATTKDYPNAYYEFLDENLDAFQALKTDANLKEYAVSLNPDYETSYKEYLKTIGEYDSDFSAKVNEMKDFIDNANFKNYVYALPSPFYTSDDTPAFTKGYMDINSKQYFALEVPADYEEEKFSKYREQKSVWAIMNNGVDKNNNAVGAVLGKFASSSFDVSASLKASPINFKTLLGFSFNELGSSIQRKIIQDNITYVSSKANNTIIMNGRCMDSRAIDYWYQWDLTSLEVERSLVQLILNGVNNPNYAIRYNQNGIDTISASIIATLNKMIEYGCVTEFGASYNSATNELLNIGYIYAVDYYSYIANQPDDYQNEVYKGISFYLRIGRYIRQVVLNITLN